MAALQKLATLIGHASKADVNTLAARSATSAGQVTLVSGGSDGVLLWAPGQSASGLAHRVPVFHDAATEEGVTSVCFHPTDPNVCFAAHGKRVSALDLRSPAAPLWSSRVATDDINQVSVHAQGGYLATADDAGVVRIWDLARKAAHKTLASRHTNIVMAAQFRPQSAWELVSAGLDSTIVQWDFGKGRALESVNTTQLAEPVLGDSAAAGGSGKESASASANGQMCNPPFVYALHMDAGGSGFTAALGDGTLRRFRFRQRGQLVLHQTLHGGHGSMVNAVDGLPGGGGGVVSGGADRKLCLWTAEPADARDSCGGAGDQFLSALRLHSSLAHTLPINAVAAPPLGSGRVYVADTSNRISELTIS